MSYPTPTAPPDANELLMGASRRGRSLSFKGTAPIWHRDMTVLAPPETMQARDPDDGTPKFYKIKGTKDDDLSAPVWQIVIKVATDYQSDEVIAEYGEDDGVRYLYVGGSKKPESRSQWAMLAQAVRTAKVKRIEPGGKISMGYVADGPKPPGTSAAFNPPKQYEAGYVAPPAGYVAPVVGGGDPGPDEPDFDDSEPPF